VVGAAWSYGIQENAMYLVTEHAKPVVAAINAFNARYGHPPNSLKDMVPEFFAAVPGTGIAVWPCYEYAQLHGKAIDPWEITVPCFAHAFGGGNLQYRASAIYPADKRGVKVQRINGWIFVPARTLYDLADEIPQ
jgi:hypothetical protein